MVVVNVDEGGAVTERNTEVEALPVGVAAAWGLRGRTGRGPKPVMSLERIVAAAVAVADVDGLAAVSMSRVAAELGAATMSLYRHVSGKEELLAHMVDAVFGMPPTVREDEDWRAGLTRRAWTLLSAWRTHPWALDVPIAGPPAMPHEVTWTEDALGTFRDTGLTDRERLSVLMLVSGYVRNQARLEAQVGEVGTNQPSYGALLRRLIDERAYPELNRLVSSGVLDDPDDADAEFSFGLDRVLDGIEALLRKRS